MITVEVKNLEPGNVAAKDIITKRGQVIAKAGTTLSAQLIARLSFYRIESVCIEEETPEVPEEIEEETGETDSE